MHLTRISDAAGHSTARWPGPQPSPPRPAPTRDAGAAGLQLRSPAKQLFIGIRVARLDLQPVVSVVGIRSATALLLLEGSYIPRHVAELRVVTEPDRSSLHRPRSRDRGGLYTLAGGQSVPLCGWWLRSTRFTQRGTRMAGPGAIELPLSARIDAASASRRRGAAASFWSRPHGSAGLAAALALAGTSFASPVSVESAALGRSPAGPAQCVGAQCADALSEEWFELSGRRAPFACGRPRGIAACSGARLACRLRFVRDRGLAA